ncbi:hypothetical protein Zmor_018147 [Zophobas morio]|uniref:Uncharacterized protein n=1 Tax=Zophobas morio TaxID=2755281 RepID=A0AA38IA03_9CUCU|nr:hypothetical protein Zmor_018147 [Zophobas morio]
MKVIVVIVLVLSTIEKSVSDIDLRYVDDTIDPCDDFHQFACGNFGKYHTRPENQSTLDLFTMTEDELVEIGKTILGSPKNSQDPIALNKAKSAYQACVKTPDYDYYDLPEISIIEEFGGMPLVTNEKVDKVSFSEIAKIAGTFGIPQLFQFTVRNSNPDFYLLIMFPDSFDPPQMVRPQSIQTYDEILEESLKKFAKIQTRSSGEDDPLDVFMLKVAKHLFKKFPGTSEEDLKKDLDDVKKFMGQLFNGGIVDDEMIDLDSAVNISDLQDWTQKQFGDEIDINWIDYLNEHLKWSNVNITEDFTLYLMPAEAVYGVLNLVRKTDPKVVKNFVLLRTFLYMAPDSDLPMRQAFEEYYKSLGYQYYERSDYCSRKIMDVVDSVSLSFAVTNNFIRYHFDINKIAKAFRIIDKLRDIFKSVIPSLDWIDDESRNTVLQKIDNVVVFLAYPVFTNDKTSLDHFYENVRICEWDNYGNARRIRAFKKAYALSQYLNHDLWTTSPFEVNAYATRASNRIMAPLSLLQSSYFNGNDPVYDYSRFGSIIAHEFIHHFDSVGVMYDNEASYNNLLSNDSMEIFETKIQCFVDQYSNFYVPEIDSYIKGNKTLDENTADNGGLKHAFAAFKQLVDSQLIENTSEKYTLEQQFFINYATQWCSDDSDAYLKKLVDSNEHAPNRYRVLGTLANMDEFSEAFSCPVGSKMNPVNKCILW